MERTIDDRKNAVNPAGAPRRTVRARRLAVAVTLLLAALAQQAAAEERRPLVVCEKVKRNGESKGVVFRPAEQGCQGKERQIETAAVPGLVNPDTPPSRQSLTCRTSAYSHLTNMFLQTSCDVGEELTGGGMTLSVDDRLQGEHFEAVQPFDGVFGLQEALACDAGVNTVVDISCHAVCCQLSD
jgi:hypothetical protein